MFIDDEVQKLSADVCLNFLIAVDVEVFIIDLSEWIVGSVREV